VGFTTANVSAFERQPYPEGWTREEEHMIVNCPKIKDTVILRRPSMIVREVAELICDQGVTGSRPVAGTIRFRANGAETNAKRRLAPA
jgi:hypothetical protein